MSNPQNELQTVKAQAFCAEQFPTLTALTAEGQKMRRCFLEDLVETQKLRAEVAELTAALKELREEMDEMKKEKKQKKSVTLTEVAVGNE